MRVLVQLILDVYDLDGFTSKHGSLDVIEERVNDAVRWLDGIEVVHSQQVTHEAESAGDGRPRLTHA